MHDVLVNRLGGLSLPRKSVVRLTDRPDMTLDVYRGRKTTIQHTLTVLRNKFTYLNTFKKYGSLKILFLFLQAAIKLEVLLKKFVSEEIVNEVTCPGCSKTKVNKLSATSQVKSSCLKKLTLGKVST